VRIAVKPTSSIAKIQQTRDIQGNVVEISVGGRHDPCIVPRVVPVAEAMLALVLMDCMLEQMKYTKRGLYRNRHESIRFLSYP